MMWRGILMMVVMTAFMAMGRSALADTLRRAYYEKLLGGGIVFLASHAGQAEDSNVQLLDFVIETKAGRQVEALQVTFDDAFNVLSEFFLPSQAHPYKMTSAPTR